MKPFLILILAIGTILPGSLLSQSDTKVSFTIAPPPVAYPEMNKGDILHKLGGGFMAINTGDFNLRGVLPSYTLHVTPSNVMAFNIQTGLGIMGGSKYGMFLMQMPFHSNLQYQVAKIGNLTVFAFGGAGMDLAFTRLQIFTQTGLASFEYIHFLTTSLMFSFNGGFQTNFTVSDFILSPYITTTHTAGTYSTTSDNIIVPASSGSIPGFTSIVFGFDALYKPLGLSLSTFISSSKDTKMVILTLGKILAKRSY